MGSKVQGSKVVGSHHKVDQQYIMKAKFKDVYDYSGRTRSAIRCFIKYLLSYVQSRRKKATLNL